MRNVLGFCQQPNHPSALASPTSAATRGITLIEVLITLTVFALLIRMSMAWFGDNLHQTRIDAAIDTLQAGLRLARTEALRRGNDDNGESLVLLTRIPPDDSEAPPTATCRDIFSAAEWGCGWRIILDTNHNNRFDAGDLVLHTQLIHIDRIGIIHAGSSAGYIAIKPNGLLNVGHRFSVSILNDFGVPIKGDSLCIAISGRIRRVRDNVTGTACQGKSG